MCSIGSFGKYRLELELLLDIRSLDLLTVSECVLDQGYPLSGMTGVASLSGLRNELMRIGFSEAAIN